MAGFEGHAPIVDDWLYAPTGEARGYIQAEALKELWIHTGTACNLSCPFCLEGSKPGDDRLGLVTLADVMPMIEQARALSVEQFSFTGGEPFVAKEFPEILDYASDHGDCLVLTNATLPLLRRMDAVAKLLPKKDRISFRVSIDYPDAPRHDSGRGAGSFDLAFEGMKALHSLGFSVSLARQMDPDDDQETVDAAYRDLLETKGLPRDMTIVAFPDFATPGSIRDVPHVTEHCMTAYQTAESRADFMCASQRMVVKDQGRMKVYACTLVDDDPDYDLGEDLAASLEPKIRMKHHRCYSCFAYGSSCSER